MTSNYHYKDEDKGKDKDESIPRCGLRGLSGGRLPHVLHLLERAALGFRD
jgi:hypothetical protein